MPDVIKGEFYLLHQRDDGIEKHHDTRTDDIVALSVLDIIVNEIHDSLSHNVSARTIHLEISLRIVFGRIA